jgi:hypothetical protein
MHSLPFLHLETACTQSLMATSLPSPPSLSHLLSL